MVSCALLCSFRVISQEFPALVGDVGGTNARFGLVFEQAPLCVQHVATVPVASQPSLAAALGTFLSAHPEIRIARTAVAVATPVTGDAVRFTNSPWSFSQHALKRELGVARLHILNDFEALALSLPNLNGAQLRLMNNQAPAQGVKAVVGPGTGLGVGSVVPTARGWLPVPGEGGHVTLAAADEFEAQVLRAARAEFAHVSAERFLSGTGLPTLYAAVCAVLGEARETLLPEQIVASGLQEQGTACAQAIDTFCAMLGGVCGNVALTVGAIGGVYVGGGIVPRLGERFFGSKFRERFEAKGRFETYLASIATPVIVDTFAALTGAALALEQSRE
jgi:glucokinase